MQTFLNIIIFILCLSAVVCIHEAGHLIAAKLSGVYCSEFSIGFGPAIFKHKFKHKKKVMNDGQPVFEAAPDGKKKYVYEKVEGETQFAIRALPLGGYVAMAGEDMQLDENGKAIPKERCLNGVNHAKQICIMLAGITLNFILAWILFFASALFPYSVNDLASPAVTVVEDSPVAQAGLQTGDVITYVYQEYQGLKGPNNETLEPIYFPTDGVNAQKVESYLDFKDGLDESDPTLDYDDLKTTSLNYLLQDVLLNVYNGVFTAPEAFEGARADVNSSRILHFKTERTGDQWLSCKVVPKKNVIDEDNSLYFYSFEPFGISASTYVVQNNFSQAFVGSFKTFGNLFTGIFNAIGSLFTPSGWQQVGGIITVYQMSAQGVSSGSLSYFLLLWGYISLNLGVFNLLPFPGLDGWQTLIALGETVTRKKASTKFKAIANTIGLVVLLGLGFLLIVKDIIML